MYVIQEQLGRCARCRQYSDLRYGYCFDCADAGERRAATRTVAQHLGKGGAHLWRRRWTNARIDFQWAWERLTRTGDYAPGGEFERQYGVTL